MRGLCRVLFPLRSSCLTTSARSWRRGRGVGRARRRSRCACGSCSQRARARTTPRSRRSCRSRSVRCASGATGLPSIGLMASAMSRGRGVRGRSLTSRSTSPGLPHAPRPDDAALQGERLGHPSRFAPLGAKPCPGNGASLEVRARTCSRFLPLALPRYSQANRTGLTPTRFAGRADLTPEDAGRVDDFHGQP